MIKKAFAAAIIFFFGSILYTDTTLARDSIRSDVRLFQTFFQDAAVIADPLAEAGFRHDDYDNGTGNILDVQGIFPVNPKIEVGAGWGYKRYSPDHGNDQSGLADFMVSGKYDISNSMTFMPADTKTSVGAYLTLPVGDEDVGEDNTDFGFFSAFRHPLYSSLVITAVIGLDFIELPDNHGDKDRDTSLLLGAGLLCPVDDRLTLVAEWNFWSEGDYCFLTGGADYSLNGHGKLRGFLGFGLDDGAPDYSIRLSYLHSF